MSDSHIVIPVTKELLEWGRECDVPISLETPAGRAPTAADVARVLDALEGFTISALETDHTLLANVESLELVEWEYEDPDPVMNKAFGGTRSSPKEWVTIRKLFKKNQSEGPFSLSFQGHMTLIIRIVQELTRDCGPLAVFATFDGIPAFFLPEGESPIWNEPWL